MSERNQLLSGVESVPWSDGFKAAQYIREKLIRWKAADGKTYEYNPWFHSYREVDEHREMVAADLGIVGAAA